VSRDTYLFHVIDENRSRHPGHLENAVTAFSSDLLFRWKQLNQRELLQCFSCFFQKSSSKVPAMDFEESKQ